MSKLSDLREALVKLEEAKTALQKARRATADPFTYKLLDGQCEVVGHAASTVRDILEREERAVMRALCGC